MSDDPTNIIRRSKTNAKADQSKRGNPGTIQFTCSNGHPIVVPAKLAGKRGACSRCGVAVVIPLTTVREPAAGKVEEEALEPVAAEEPEDVSAPVIDEPMPVGPEAAEGTTPDEAAGAMEMPDFSGIGGEAGAAVAEDGPPDADAFEGLAAVAEPQAPAFGEIEGGAAPEIDGVDNPTAVLVAKLFGESEHGGVVELHLKSGQIVMPLLYDFNWSRGTHGVFAAENKSDNTITLMAVAWDSVEQVIVRKVRGLPDGMFE